MQIISKMISVIIPVYNEEKILADSILILHEFLEREKIPHEIIVVNNGSTDKTEEKGVELAKEYPWFRFFSIPDRAVGKAFALGVKESGSDYLVSLDIDLSFELKFIDYAKDLLQYCDMLVGSKIMGNQKRSIIRLVGSQLYIFLSQLFLGLNLSDYSIGAKAFRKSAILKTLPYLDRWTGYVLELSLYLKIHEKRIIQIGIDCLDQRKSHFNLLYEARYRYAHMFKCWMQIKSKTSWFYKAA